MNHTLFQQWYRDRNWLVLDTETTGLDNHAEIVEIAILDPDGHTIFESLIHPAHPIPHSATLIHGITNEDVAHAPTWRQVYPQLKKILSSKLILIYNAKFDTRLIEQTCHFAHLPPLHFHHQCVMEAYRELKGYKRWISLEKACLYERVDVPAIQAHRAKEDCLWVLGLIEKLGK